MNITKDELLQRVRHSLLFEKKPIECPYDLLRFPFGFKRVSGEAFLIAKLLRPSVTEEGMSYLPKNEIVKSVMDWAEVNGFACSYDDYSLGRDCFTFYSKTHNMNRLRTYLDCMSYLLDRENAPKECVLFMPTTRQEFMNDLISDRCWMILHGPDKGNFEGPVIRYNDRVFYFIDAKIEY
jgi:hypothetical protein